MGRRLTPSVMSAPATTAASIGNERSDWCCGLAVEMSADDGRSTEQWARSAWEGAPFGVRWLLVAGWRWVLGLRLVRGRGADSVLGWSIVERLPNETVVEARSRLLTAHNTFRREDGRLIWSTFVRYDRPFGRIVWLPVSLLHRPMVRYALRRAARNGVR